MRRYGIIVLLLVGVVASGCRNAPRNPAALTPAPTPIPTAPPTSTIPGIPGTALPDASVSPGASSEPAPGTYVVQAGDTLLGIATQYSVTVEALQQANPGVVPENLQIGQELKLP